MMTDEATNGYHKCCHFGIHSLNNFSHKPVTVKDETIFVYSFVKRN